MLPSTAVRIQSGARKAVLGVVSVLPLSVKMVGEPLPPEKETDSLRRRRCLFQRASEMDRPFQLVPETSEDPEKRELSSVEETGDARFGEFRPMELP